MINTESLAAVDRSRLDDRFGAPLYDGYSFAQIPATIRALLTNAAPAGVPFGPRADLWQPYDAVILLFVDAFGWRFFAPLADRAPFLKRIVRAGLVNKLSAQFPSTTAAHVTTIHTGLPVGQSGVYEWFYYEPLLDTIIAPLLFSFAGDPARGTLSATGVDPATLYPRRTLYSDLAQHGVRSYVLHHAQYAASPYSRVATRGATVVPYRTLPEALVTLAQLVAGQQQRSYYYLYWEGIDTVCHHHGPESPQVAAEIDVFLHALETVLHPRLARVKPRTLLLITADHGQTAIDPATTIYLNQTLPELLPLLRTNRSGRVLAPAGSSRDMFVHVQEKRINAAYAMLERHLAGRADVYRVPELIARGMFGPPPIAPELLARIGDLVILPYAGESVWWWEQDRFEQHFYGSHGGLLPDELHTILLALPYGS